MTQASTLATLFSNWEKYQAGLVQALAPLTKEQLALRAAPELRSISEIARHIIGARCRWFHDALGEGSEAIVPLSRWDRKGEPERSAAELVQSLQASWKELKDALDRWTPEDFTEEVSSEYQGKTYTFTRDWIIWHLIEHDLHHGGEISLTLGMHGLKAPDL